MSRDASQRAAQVDAAKCRGLARHGPPAPGIWYRYGEQFRYQYISASHRRDRSKAKDGRAHDKMSPQSRLA